MDELFTQINALLRPYILGYWSENNGGGLVVTNTACTHYRGFGARTWTHFATVPNNIYNTNLAPATADQISKKVLADFLKAEGFGSSVINGLPEKGVWIPERCEPFFLALRGDLQGQYHYCLMKTDPLETTGAQLVSYLFPGTVFDLYDQLPESEVTDQYSAFVGGSLSWLAGLDTFGSIFPIIRAAKARLA